MSLINNAPIAEPVNKGGKLLGAWPNWFGQVFRICFDVQNSGPTASRPSTNLYPGKFYFDTTLGAAGMPIYVNKTSTGWVDAQGNPA